jgi:hypothetical protein
VKLQKQIWNKISGEKIWKTKFKNKFGIKNSEAKKLKAKTYDQGRQSF